MPHTIHRYTGRQRRLLFLHLVIYSIPCLVNTYTFSSPGKSSLSYIVKWDLMPKIETIASSRDRGNDNNPKSTTPDFQIHFRFKTWQSTTLLMKCQINETWNGNRLKDRVDGYGVDKGNDDSPRGNNGRNMALSSVNEKTIRVALYNGQLHIKAGQKPNYIHENGYEDGETEMDNYESSKYDNGDNDVIGQDGHYFEGHLTTEERLNTNIWQHIYITLNKNKNVINVTLNGNNSLAITVPVEIQQLQSHMVEVKVLFGGDVEYPFAGCVNDITFHSGKKNIVPTNKEQKSVVRGCVDLCLLPNQCWNHGHCLNVYTGTLCDCMGTGYEGKYCEKYGLKTITVQGTEWMTFRVFQAPVEKLYGINDRVALQFKTHAKEGILFYGNRDFPHYSHLALSLKDGMLHVSVVYENEQVYSELYTSIGNQLDNDRWHNVTLTFSSHEVLVVVDSDSEKMVSDVKVEMFKIPEVVFYGGMKATGETRGLKSMKGFVGCLRGLYVNQMSVLEYLPSAVGDKETEHSDIVTYDSLSSGDIMLGCVDSSASSLQFTHDGSFTMVPCMSEGVLDISFQFRTNKDNCVLLHNTIIKGTKQHGYLQILLEDGALVLRARSNTKHVNTKIVATHLNDNSWHTFAVFSQQSSLTITIDNIKKYEDDGVMTMSYSAICYLAFSPVTPRYGGFVGCLRNIFIHQEFINPVKILHSDSTVGVTLGSCNLVDQCKNRQSKSLCQHKGQCVSEWTGIICDCRHTHYQGRYCQFEKLFSTCDEILHSGGVTKSGIYSIVPGTEFSYITMMNVNCTMALDQRGQYIGVTVVSHNLQPETVIRAPGFQDLQKIITYRTVSNAVLMNLIRMSSSCEQVLEFTCLHAPLRFGEKTWLGSEGMYMDISVPSSKCDSDTAITVSDKIVIKDKAELPVTDIYVRQTKGKAYVTLGPLVCKGSVSRDDKNAVTFTHGGRYLYIPTLWYGGEIKLDFRSKNTKAVLLYHHGPHGNNLKISLISGNSLQFLLPMSRSPYNIVTAHKLNDTKWHSVTMEVQNGELRVIVDGQTFLMQVETDGTNQHIPNKEIRQGLYIGGDPRLQNEAGFTGCIRSLVIEGNIKHLSQLIPASDNSKLPGCVSQCDSTPCHHGGLCVENWTKYHCICANKLAHLGTNCETDINEDIIQFTKDRGSLQIPMTKTINLQQISLVFSFKTRKKKTELIHATDIHDNTVTICLYNGTVVEVELTGSRQAKLQLCSPDFANGTWQQVGLSVQDETMTLIINDQLQSVRVRKKIERPAFVGNEYTFPILHIGRYSYHKTSVIPSDMTLFTGCIRGVKISDRIINLRKQSRYVPGIEAGCSSICDKKELCINGGKCITDTITDTEKMTYTCDCTDTGYAGTNCDREIGVHFNGKTIIVQWFKSDNAGSLFTQVSFVFSTSIRNNHRMLLIQLLGKSGSSVRVTLYLSETCTLVTNYTTSSSKSVITESSFSMCDGMSHHVKFSRKQQQFTLTVDEEVSVHNLFTTPCTTVDPAMMVVVGGLITPGYIELTGYHNFTGDLSNLFIKSDQLSIVSRPLDVASGFVQTTDEQITVYGTVLPANHTLVEHTSKTSGLTVTSDNKQVELPPIHPANADTVILTASTEIVRHNSSMNVGLVVGICVGILIFIAIVIAIIYFRYCRKKQKQWSPETIKKDEEEGLLTDGASSPSSSPSKGGIANSPTDIKDNQEDGKKLPDVTYRPKGMKNGTNAINDKKKSQLPFDDDNEATPMLLSMQQNIPNDTVELTSFQAELEKMPMIDDGEDESSLEDIPAVPLKSTETVPTTTDEVPVQRASPHTPDVIQNGGVHKDAGYVNQVERLSQEEEDRRSPTSTEEIIPQDNVQEDPGQLPDPEALKVKLRKHRGVSPERKVLTESMVLDMLETKEGETVAPGANTSFSSLPEDSQPILDLEVQADVHHRTISFDGVGDDPGEKFVPPQVKVALNGDTHKNNGINQSAYCNSSSSLNSDENPQNLPVIIENNGHSNQSFSNGTCVNGLDNASQNGTLQNGLHTHSNDNINAKTDDVITLNTKTGDIIKSNGPSVVVDSSLNEITEDPR